MAWAQRLRNRQPWGRFAGSGGSPSMLGAIVGVVAGQLLVLLMRSLLPINAEAPHWAVAAAVCIALLSGLVFGILPARRAARLEPVAALAGRS